jgi:hypothetical protein
MSITVDVKAGARIISLKIDDHEILGSPAVGDKQLIAYIHHFINAHPQAQ